MSKSTSARSGRVWAYLGTITGGAVSIAANVAHTYVPPKGLPAWLHYRPQFGAVVGAVFWPLALFIVIETLARVAWPKGGRWVLLRFAGLAPVAVVAAIVSYRHLSGLLAYYGEDSITRTIGPLAVDGLMVMATGALIATGAGHVKAAAVRLPVLDGATSAGPDPTGAPMLPAAPADMSALPDATGTADAPRQRTSRTPGPAKPTGARKDGAATKERVAGLMSANPQMSTADMAKELDMSDRQVRRHVAALTATGA